LIAVVGKVVTKAKVLAFQARLFRSRIVLSPADAVGTPLAFAVPSPDFIL
jgi:hypothetical protein